MRAKNLSSEKLDSIYNDVGTAKKFIKWYLIIAGAAGNLIIAGAAGILALTAMAYFAFNAVYVW